MTASACEGCGIVLPGLSGASHPYMTSSVACWASYGELLAVQYGDAERMAFHQLVVDAYAVQHPVCSEGADPRAVQSVGIHLMTLCLFLEYGVDPALGTSLHGSMVSRPVFTTLSAPSDRGALTHDVVPRDGGSETARLAAYAWATSAWQAWHDHDAQVREWLATAGLLPD